MEFVSNIFVLPVLLVALGTIAVMAPLLKIEAPRHRYTSIDGIRGFLAMFVFLHHSSSWFYFARIHQWSVIPSNLFNQFGSTSVALFFMITSFLFFSKLIDGYGSRFDWLKLYVGRTMRIMPLYLTVVVFIFIVVAIVTHFTLHQGVGAIITQFAQWVLIMEPNVNGLNGTKFIICGVQWSLAYEWMFYCALAPIGVVFFRLKPLVITLFVTVAFLVLFYLIIQSYYPSRFWWRLCPFISGLAAAIAARSQNAKTFFSGWEAAILILVLGYVGVFIYPLIFSFVPMVCVSIAFVGIACGNDLFGFLSWKPCRQLGQISYSIYLLHGLILFTAFYFVLGFRRAAGLSPIGHWLVICGCGVLVVIVGSFAYSYIEKPGISAGTPLTGQIRSGFRSKRSSKVPIAS